MIIRVFSFKWASQLFNEMEKNKSESVKEMFIKIVWCDIGHQCHKYEMELCSSFRNETLLALFTQRWNCQIFVISTRVLSICSKLQQMDRILVVLSCCYYTWKSTHGVNQPLKTNDEFYDFQEQASTLSLLFAWRKTPL